MNARDAVSALNDLGVDLGELNEYYLSEGRDMSRYAVHSLRRKEDIAEFNGSSTHVGSLVFLTIPHISCPFCRSPR